MLRGTNPFGSVDFNFYGRYEFTKGLEPINVEASVEALAQQPLMPGEDEA